MVKIFKYSNRHFDFKSELAFSQTIKQIVEIDQESGIFAIIMDHSEEIQILRVDLVTGDYKIDRRDPLLPKKGYIVKKVTVL